MLADIAAQRVEIVVVYKIDRLSRSLTDFAHLVKLFETHGVTFVSVTQHFNTTTSMGRLTLNILLSFAQFEREITGERIRDKIAASKKKGMWMGGVPPFGYDVRHRRLVINPQEAKQVRHVFKRFTELGSVTLLVKELRQAGVTSKTWTTQTGHRHEGKLVDKSTLYPWLNNRTYLGELRYREQWYPGEHEPIIDASTWAAVQAILAQHARVRVHAAQATVPFLLKGIVFGSDGRALSPSHTTKKNGRRYRYYLPQRDAKEHAGASGLPRLPADALETAVLDQLRAVWRAPERIQEVVTQAVALDPTLDEAQVTVAMTRLEVIWAHLFPAEQSRLVRLLVEQVIVSPQQLDIRLRPSGLEQLTHELGSTSTHATDDTP